MMNDELTYSLSYGPGSFSGFLPGPPMCLCCAASWTLYPGIMVKLQHKPRWMGKVLAPTHPGPYQQCALPPPPKRAAPPSKLRGGFYYYIKNTPPLLCIIRGGGAFGIIMGGWNIAAPAADPVRLHVPVAPNLPTSPLRSLPPNQIPHYQRH